MTIAGLNSSQLSCWYSSEEEHLTLVPEALGSIPALEKEKNISVQRKKRRGIGEEENNEKEEKNQLIKKTHSKT